MVRETNTTMEHQQLKNEEAKPFGSTSIREALKVRKASMKKTLKKNKKKVLKKIVYFDSDEGSKEPNIEWEKAFYAQGYCDDFDKIM